MTHRVTLQVETDDLEALTEGIKAFERLGCRVECPAHDARERLRLRDEYLRAAHALMPGLTPWARCCQLEKEIATFEAVLWPRWRERETAPECSALRSLLFRARQIGPLPTTGRQIRNIAKRNALCDFTSSPLQLPSDLR